MDREVQAQVKEPELADNRSLPRMDALHATPGVLDVQGGALYGLFLSQEGLLHVSSLHASAAVGDRVNWFVLYRAPPSRRWPLPREARPKVVHPKAVRPKTA